MVLLRKSIPYNHNLKTAAELGVSFNTNREIVKLIYLLVSVLLSIAIFFVVSGRAGAVSKIYAFSVSNINSETQGEIVTSDYIRAPLSSKVRGYSITYKYNVNGKSFVSNLVSFAHSSTETAAEYVNRYPAGKNVVVYYSSEAPKFSILERKNPDFMVFFQAISSLFISVFFGFLIPLFILKLAKYDQKKQS